MVDKVRYFSVTGRGFQFTPQERTIYQAGIEKGRQMERAVKRECKQSLDELSRACFIFLRRLDEVMKLPSAAERGKSIARLSNDLELQNDSVRYSQLGVNYRNDNKDKVWQALKGEANGR